MEILRRIAVFLMFIGFGSVILYFMEYSFRIISWLDEYQPFAGGAIGALGVVLMVITVVAAKKPAPAQMPVPPQA
ncbi:MAG TPA: hypothetical protein VM677_25275 [Actinokineospora sp.]|nr:hypothetical protein [Actinokineospora sp.]